MKDRKLPNGWEWKRIKDIAEINPGVDKNALTSDTEVTFLPMRCVQELSGKITTSNIKRYHEVKSGYTPIKEGDLLFAKITPCIENGKIAIALNLKNGFGFASTEFHVLRFNSNQSVKFYFFYLLQQRIRQEAARNMTGTAGQQRVPASFLKELKIPIPPLPIQRQIVAILEQAEATKQLRAESDELTKRLLQSIFMEMFGDPVRNEKGWEVIPLEKACSEIYRYPTFYGFKYTSNGVPIVRISNILINGGLDSDLSNYVFIGKKISQNFPRTILEFNDILMAVRGDGSTVKRIGIVNTQNLIGANMSPNLIRIKTNQDILNPKYLFYLMTSFHGQIILEKNVSRTAKKTITAENIKQISIPLPPLNYQQEFAQIINYVEDLRHQFRQSANEINALLDALLQKAFTGELAA